METIKGYLQEMPEMMFTQQGTALLKFHIAEKPGVELNEWLRVICWGDLAERANDVLVPNAEDGYFPLLYAKGYWKERSWAKYDGTEEITKEFTAKGIWLIDETGQAQPFEL